jgi:hypothetical protein
LQQFFGKKTQDAVMLQKKYKRTGGRDELDREAQAAWRDVAVTP